MPFIEKQEVITPVELKVKIEPDVHADLLKYYEFMKPSKPDYVITEVLRKVMRLDKDFQRHIGRGKSQAKAKAA